MLPQLSHDGQKTTWVIFGLVSGGIPEFCGSREHPTRFLRLDDEEINHFIHKTIGDFAIPPNNFSSTFTKKYILQRYKCYQIFKL